MYPNLFDPNQKLFIGSSVHDVDWAIA